MENLNRNAAGRLARIVCQDIVRWEPEAYATAFESKRVVEDLAEAIETGRVIFQSRAPTHLDLFERAVTTCLVEGDPSKFDAFVDASTRSHGEPPTKVVAMGSLLLDVSTLTKLTVRVLETSVGVTARLVEVETADFCTVTCEEVDGDGWLVSLDGDVASQEKLQGARASLSPERGFLTFLKKPFELTIGDAGVDDAYLINAKADATLMLRRNIEPLQRLSAFAPEIRFEPNALSVMATVENNRDCALFVDAAIDLWARERLHRALSES